jgi:DNA-binding Xre family transcriptional regulator
MEYPEGAMTSKPVVRTVRRPGAGVAIDIGKLLRMRQTKLLSRSQLATKMSTDPDTFTITADAIAKIENGHRKPKTSTFGRLCAALHCEPEDLLPDPDRPPRPQPCSDCGGVFGHESGCRYAT